ncbi:hypothetical protein RAS2_09710 [Phycisphaerae bacterium RAS2]|nr:hypothetical protein RAS2_09710 [Phycisphaerae bacterium RAS2]
MFIGKNSAIVFRYSIYTFMLVMFAHRSALAQCGGRGGGMSCGGHSMSGHDMGHASHSSGLSNGHSTTGHTPGTPHSSTIRNHSWGGAAPSNWMLPSGHGTHAEQGRPGNSPSWSSTPIGIRQSGARLANGLVDPTIRSRASIAFRTSLPGHAMNHWNGAGNSAGRMNSGVDDTAPVGSPRLQRTISSSSLLPRLPSTDSNGIQFSNHSAHRPYQDLTSDSSPGLAAKLRSRARSGMSLPGSLGLRSQTQSDQTALQTSRIRSLDSTHASHTWPNPNSRFEESVPPTNVWTPWGASGTRPVLRSSLDGFSAIELPATGGLEAFMARTRKAPTTQPGNEPSTQTGI